MDNHLWCNQVTTTVRPAPHVFTDLMDLVPRDLLDGASTFEEKLHRIQNCPISTACPCAGLCTPTGFCRVPSTDIDVGGLPCVDFAQCGLRRGCNGPTAPLFMVWSTYHKSRKTKLVILENAPESGTESNIVLFW